MPPFNNLRLNQPNSRAANRELTHLHSPTNHSAPYPLHKSRTITHDFFPPKPDGVSAHDDDVTLLPCLSIFQQIGIILNLLLIRNPFPTVELTSNDNIELAISELNQNFTEAFVEASKPKFNNAPKILSPEIKFKIYQRNRLRKFWQRTRCPSIYSQFRTLSREIAKDIQAYSRVQWEKHIEALSPVDNTLWRKSSLLRKPFQSIPPLKGALGSIAITPIEKAEVIADSLQVQFEPNHVAGRELFDQRIHDEVTNFINTPHVQEIEPTTPTEVLSYVQRLKPRKSPDLIRFLIQCGFRPKCSTVHQLLRVTELIHSGFAKHEATGILFLDIAKAFDKIWHDGLLIKLIRLDFPPPDQVHS
ncbi:RNA-directed DNA polymerase from mobile element jockey [Trichonephila clavipes]|nr:RNA-directed DNA polymerase from mobile element jockey [Trichonephila clavipes]